MSESKKYFWLKLKDDFFSKKEIKKLRSIAGGDTYTIIYLKIQLLSVKTGGIIQYDGIEDNLAEELALVLDENPENVKVTISLLSKMNLIEQLSEKEYLLPDTAKLIGSESDSKERVRLYRERKKNQLSVTCNAEVTKCNTEIEIDIEKDTEKEKEKKPKKTTTNLSLPSSPEEVELYAHENGYEGIGEAFFRYYNNLGWKDKHGKPVKNWKAKCRNVWFTDERKIKPKKPIHYGLPEELQRSIDAGESA